MSIVLVFIMSVGFLVYTLIGMQNEITLNRLDIWSMRHDLKSADSRIDGKFTEMDLINFRNDTLDSMYDMIDSYTNNLWSFFETIHENNHRKNINFDDHCRAHNTHC